MTTIKLSKLPFLFLAGVFVFVLNACQSTKSTAGSRMLRFNFENGKSYDYEMIVDMDQKIDDQTQSVSMTARYGMDVTGETEGVKTITTRFDHFVLSMQMMGLNIEVDTDKPDTTTSKNPLSMMSRAFRAISGQRFTMRVNQEGRVLEVSGLDKMADNIVDSLQLGNENRETIRQSFRKQFSDESMKEQFERAFFIFPNKEVKVGDSWTKKSKMISMMSTDMVSTYTVDEIEGDMVTLKVNSEIDGSGENVKFAGNEKGTMVVDSRTGLIMKADMSQDFHNKAGNKDIRIIGKSRIRGQNAR